MSILSIILEAYKILNLKKLNKIYLLFCLIVLTAILEVASLGLLLPIISNIFGNEKDLVFLEFLTNYEIINLMYFFLIFFLLKTLFNIFLIKKQIVVKNYITSYFLSKYFDNLLYREFLFFKKNNTNYLVKNIINEAPEVINNIIYNSLLLLTDFFIVLMIVSFIFINFFSISVFLFPLLLIFLFIYLNFLKKKVSKLGIRKFEILQNIIKYLTDGFGSIIQIKLSSSENSFSKTFKDSSDNFFNISGIHSFYQLIPRYLMELFLLLSFFIIFFIYDYLKFDLNQLFTFLSLLIVASLKIMPAIARVISSIQAIQYSYPVLKKIKDQLNDNSNLENRDKKDISFRKNIKLQNLNYQYDNDEIIFDDINFEFNKGDIVGISGPNGSGKSTLLNILMGLLPVKKNMLLIDNIETNINETNWHKNISYVSNNSFLLDSNVENNIAFVLDENEINKKQLNKSIDFLGLNNFIQSLENGLKTNIGQNGARISSGQKQKICLARAFYSNNDILIFDEATNSLDLNSEEKFYQKLKNLKGLKTVIIVSHNKKNLTFCDKILEITKK